MHGTNGIIPACLRLRGEGASMWPMLSGGVFNYRSNDQKMADALGILSRDEFWGFLGSVNSCIPHGQFYIVHSTEHAKYQDHRFCLSCTHVSD